MSEIVASSKYLSFPHTLPSQMNAICEPNQDDGCSLCLGDY